MTAFAQTLNRVKHLLLGTASRSTRAVLLGGCGAALGVAVWLVWASVPHWFSSMVLSVPSVLLLTLAVLWMGWRCRAHGYLRPDLSWPAGVAVILILVSVVWGQAIYRIAQEKAQVAMLKAVQQADVIAELCAQTPGLLQVDCKGPLLYANADDEPKQRKLLSDQAVWQVLLESGVIDATKVPNPVSMAAAAATQQPLNSVVTFLKASERGAETSIALVERLASVCKGNVELERGTSSDNDPSKPQQGDEWQAAIAFSLAGLDGNGIRRNWLPSRLQSTQEQGSRTPPPPPLPESVQLYELPRTAKFKRDELTALMDLLRMRIPAGATDQEILTAILFASASLTNKTDDASYAQYRSPENRSPDGEVVSYAAKTCDTANLTTDEERFTLFDYQEKSALYTLGQIRMTEKVRSAKLWAMLVTGYEQLAMLVLFVLALLLSGLRLAALGIAVHRRTFWFAEPASPIKAVVFALRSSRWPLRLIAATLPAIGFIGTARGIMLSLSGAEQIVWANTVNDRAAAIGALASDLGLAFSTTLIALALGIVLSLLLAVEQRLIELAAARKAASEAAHAAQQTITG